MLIRCLICKTLSTTWLSTSGTLVWISAQHTTKCLCCQKREKCTVGAEVKPNFYKPPDVQWVKATQPFERLSLDFKGPLPSSTKNIICWLLWMSIHAFLLLFLAAVLMLRPWFFVWINCLRYSECLPIYTLNGLGLRVTWPHFVLAPSRHRLQQHYYV